MSLLVGTWQGWWCDGGGGTIEPSTLTIRDAGNGNVTGSFSATTQVSGTFTVGYDPSAPTDGEVGFGNFDHGEHPMCAFMVVSSAQDTVSACARVESGLVMFFGQRDQPTGNT